MELRRITSAELLSIGSELTVGETRDTNAGDLARALTQLGVTVGRIQAVPDELETVRDAFEAALGRADLVVSTGGLGPTPDDLTREAIAALSGEAPSVDPGLEAWLREIWARRGMPFPELNLKQAWLISSTVAIANPNGTAPGWWVDRPDGRLIVAMPGPPREMRPMWSEQVLPRLQERGLGRDIASRTFRLAGIGESQVADLLGDELLRGRNPEVATYARSDAVDVRISAIGDADRSGSDLVSATADRVAAVLHDYVWAEGETTWSEAIGSELTGRDWTLSVVEVGTGGSLTGLIGDREWLRLGQSLAPDAPAAVEHRPDEDDASTGDTATDGASTDDRPSPTDGLEQLARAGAASAGADVGVGVRARPRGADTAVTVVVITPNRAHRERRLVFLGGSNGRSRAALAAAHVLLRELRAEPGG